MKNPFKKSLRTGLEAVLNRASATRENVACAVGYLTNNFTRPLKKALQLAPLLALPYIDSPMAQAQSQNSVISPSETNRPPVLLTMETRNPIGALTRFHPREFGAGYYFYLIVKADNSLRTSISDQPTAIKTRGIEADIEIPEGRFHSVTPFALSGGYIPNGIWHNRTNDFFWQGAMSSTNLIENVAPFKIQRYIRSTVQDNMLKNQPGSGIVAIFEIALAPENSLGATTIKLKNAKAVGNGGLVQNLADAELTVHTVNTIYDTDFLGQRPSDAIIDKVHFNGNDLPLVYFEAREPLSRKEFTAQVSRNFPAFKDLSKSKFNPRFNIYDPISVVDFEAQTCGTGLYRCKGTK